MIKFIVRVWISAEVTLIATLARSATIPINIMHVNPGPIATECH